MPVDEFEQHSGGGRPTACFFTIHAVDGDWEPEWVETRFCDKLSRPVEDWYPGAVPAPFRERKIRFGVCAAEEGGETGAKHFQAVVILQKGVSASYSQWKELLAAVFEYPVEKVWTMRCRSIPAGVKYCSGKHRESTTSSRWVDKPGVLQWAEFGEYDDKSGSRNDLKAMKEVLDKHVLAGEKRSFAQIALGDDESAQIAFMGMMKYPKGVNDYVDAGAMSVARGQRPDAWWFYGTSGAGKSRAARLRAIEFIKARYPGISEEDAMARIYYKPDGDWFTGYSNQQHDVVILEELRPAGKGDMQLLCKMVDENPFNVNRKAMREMPFNAGLVIVTSPMSPVEAFEGRLNTGDSIQQVSRRFGFRQFHLEVDDDGSENYTDWQMWYDLDHDMMSSGYTRKPARYPPVPE